MILSQQKTRSDLQISNNKNIRKKNLFNTKVDNHNKNKEKERNRKKKNKRKRKRNRRRIKNRKNKDMK
jgi:hypothetical protein